jgi:hypothetical protein
MTVKLTVIQLGLQHQPDKRDRRTTAEDMLLLPQISNKSDESKFL